jgi:hypothetical protein
MPGALPLPVLPLSASRVAVDPAAVAALPAPLYESASAIRSGTPALLSAWDHAAAAAAAAAAQHTGLVLADCRPGCAAELAACAAAVEDLASGLRGAAATYAQDDEDALPAVRARAWIP